MKDNKTLIILIIVLAVLCIAGVGGYYYIKSLKPAISSVEETTLDDNGATNQVITETETVQSTAAVGTTEAPVPAGVQGPSGLPAAPAAQ